MSCVDSSVGLLTKNGESKVTSGEIKALKDLNRDISLLYYIILLKPMKVQQL